MHKIIILVITFSKDEYCMLHHRELVTELWLFLIVQTMVSMDIRCYQISLCAYLSLFIASVSYVEPLFLGLLIFFMALFSTLTISFMVLVSSMGIDQGYY